MTRSPRTILGAVLACAVLASGGTSFANRSSACTFNISPEAASPEIVAADPVKERARVMVQPDSPLAILRVDLIGMTPSVAGGSFVTGGRYAMDVKNVSDQVLTSAQVQVQVGTGPARELARASKWGPSVRAGRRGSNGRPVRAVAGVDQAKRSPLLGW